MKAWSGRWSNCGVCGRPRPDYELIRITAAGHSTLLCLKCSSMEAARRIGLVGYQHPDLQPVRIVDCEGKPHTFHFTSSLFEDGITLEAFELRRGERCGYQFRLIGDHDDDVLELTARLIEKIRRRLARKDLESRDGILRIAGFTVRATIDWSGDERGSLPMLTIDGRDISWDQFGRMLMSYEGWQFRMEIKDSSDEV